VFNRWDFYANVISFGFFSRTEKASKFNSKLKQLFQYNVQRERLGNLTRQF
jgi:hypothetical protein